MPTILHTDLPEDDLHYPRGFSSAPSLSYPLKSGGSLFWVPAHEHLSATSASPLTLDLLAGEAQQVTLNSLPTYQGFTSFAGNVITYTPSLSFAVTGRAFFVAATIDFSSPDILGLELDFSFAHAASSLPLASSLVSKFTFAPVADGARCVANIQAVVNLPRSDKVGLLVKSSQAGSLNVNKVSLSMGSLGYT